MTNENVRADYLIALKVLSRRFYVVRPVDIAGYLKVSRATVSTTLKKLSAGGFLYKDTDHSLHLTEDGSRIAERLYENYRFLHTLFLSYGMTPEQAEREAVVLGQAMSAEARRILEQALLPVKKQDAVLPRETFPAGELSVIHEIAANEGIPA